VLAAVGELLGVEQLPSVHHQAANGQPQRSPAGGLLALHDTAERSVAGAGVSADSLAPQEHLAT
jgi:hypothetical protein